LNLFDSSVIPRTFYKFLRFSRTFYKFLKFFRTFYKFLRFFWTFMILLWFLEPFRTFWNSLRGDHDGREGGQGGARGGGKEGRGGEEGWAGGGAGRDFGEGRVVSGRSGSVAFDSLLCSAGGIGLSYLMLSTVYTWYCNIWYKSDLG